MRSNCKGRLDSSRVIKLSYKNRLYFKSLHDKDTPKEKYFMVFQVNYFLLGLPVVNYTKGLPKQKFTNRRILIGKCVFVFTD